MTLSDDTVIRMRNWIAGISTFVFFVMMTVIDEGFVSWWILGVNVVAAYFTGAYFTVLVLPPLIEFIERSPDPRKTCPKADDYPASNPAWRSSEFPQARRVVKPARRLSSR